MVLCYGVLDSVIMGDACVGNEVMSLLYRVYTSELKVMTCIVISVLIY